MSVAPAELRPAAPPIWERGLLGLAGLVTLFVLLDFPEPPSDWLDASWQAALTDAHVHGRQFGKEVIFTFGPWGWLTSHFIVGGALTGKLVWEFTAKAVLAVFSKSVFPEMNVTWGAYPNNLGHTDFDGCFRCHDERPSKDGSKTIPQDCDTCHKTLAQDEESPKILADMGLDKPKTTVN